MSFVADVSRNMCCERLAPDDWSLDRCKINNDVLLSPQNHKVWIKEIHFLGVLIIQ